MVNVSGDVHLIETVRNAVKEAAENTDDAPKSMAPVLDAEVQKELNKDLFKALADNDITKAVELVQAGTDVNARNQNDEVPLTAVMKSGLIAEHKKSLMNLLLDHDADPNAFDRNGSALFYVALAAVDLEQQYLDAKTSGASPEQISELRSERSMYLQIGRMLVEHGASELVNAPGNQTPFKILQDAQDDELRTTIAEARHARIKAKKEKRENKMKNAKMPQNTTSADDENPMAKLVVRLPDEKPEAVIQEINTLIGHDDFKREARQLYFKVKFNEACKANGLPVKDPNYHLALTGNPGVGKTMQAKMRARLLHSLGIIGDRYAEVSRDALVGKHIGETEDKFNKLKDISDIIFIDESYSLASDSGSDRRDFGNRIVEALMKDLDKKEGPRKVYMFAGYTDEMDSMFNSNSGFYSRVEKRHIEDPTMDQLKQILMKKVVENGRSMDDETASHFMDQVSQLKSILGAARFGNGRILDKAVEKMPEIMAERLYSADINATPTKEELMAITKADIDTFDPIRHFAGTKVSVLKGAEKRVPGFKPAMAMM